MLRDPNGTDRMNIHGRQTFIPYQHDTWIRLDWQPNELLRQLIHSIMGFIFFGGIRFDCFSFHTKERDRLL